MTTPGDRPAPRALRGRLCVPGDKSVTHRALLLGAVAEGTSVVRGALDALDTRSTAGVVAALGAELHWPVTDAAKPAPAPHELSIVGVESPRSPAAPLDCGNAGTAARLVLGVLAGRSGRWTLDGDDSLRARPMARVAEPLRALGARIDGDRLPLGVEGRPLRGGRVRVELPSAQVKSALLLAGLAADGPLTVVQPTPTRDHTERLLAAFGVRCEVDGDACRVHPGRPLAARIDVPGDPSAAAFLVVAALLTPGSELELEHVGLWPRRTGFLRVLRRAGADIVVQPREGTGLDPVGSLRVRAGPLRPLEVAPDEVPDLVDEIPALALAAARAEGHSRFAGLAELRVKESDRVATVARLLADLGVPVGVAGDELSVTGVARFSDLPRGAHDDHRLALVAAIARHVHGAPPAPDEPSAAVSWPGFGGILAALASHA